MHMADALVSPPVAGAMWAASAATIAYSSRKIRQDLDERKVPLMGVLGAFVFAVQMINFTIPGTGSSGHLGGGILLAILLGPHAAFLTIASVLFVQALFFADGGLLALACNIMNLGFLPAFLCYPLIYRNVAGCRPGPGRRWAACILTAVAALQAGALGVVAETAASGVAQLPVDTFLLLMLPIHLAIGVVEGVVTAALISFIAGVRPDLLDGVVSDAPLRPLRKVVAGMLVAAAMTAGIVSWFASESPDGLEWSIRRIVGKTALAAPEGRLHPLMSLLQEKAALFPDYALKREESSRPTRGDAGERAETSLAGLIGGGLTLALALAVGFFIKGARRCGLRERKRPVRSE